MANCLWDTWTCHSLSNIVVCANASSNISKHQPAGKRLKEKHVGCQYSSMLCFHMYKPRTNSEYASNQPVYNGRNTSSGKALACWFFICTNLKQTLFKPQIYGAGPWQQVRQDFLKESSINFFFCARATVDFLRCLEWRFDWGLYIWKHSRSRVWSWHGFLQ